MFNTVERKKLIEYLPPVMKNFSEFKEIMRTENAETDRISGNMQRVLDNAFIESCDSYGIKKYEAMLKLFPSPEDTIESRRLRVLIRWNEFIPYTYRVLIRKLNAFCGVNGYDILPDLENYNLTLDIHVSVSKQREEIEKFLNRIMPMNFSYRVNIKYNTHKVLAGYTHNYLSQYTHKGAREEEL